MSATLVEITITKKEPFRAGESVVFHGRKAHVASFGQAGIFYTNVPIIYDDNKDEKEHIAVVPAKDLKRV